MCQVINILILLIITDDKKSFVAQGMPLVNLGSVFDQQGRIFDLTGSLNGFRGNVKKGSKKIRVK